MKTFFLGGDLLKASVILFERTSVFIPFQNISLVSMSKSVLAKSSFFCLRIFEGLQLLVVEARLFAVPFSKFCFLLPSKLVGLGASFRRHALAFLNSYNA